VIVVTAILPVIVGALVVALLAIFQIQGGVSKRISDSADAQVVSSYYEQDVHGAAYLTTSASVTQCGSGTQLLGLESNYNPTTKTFQTVISYVKVQRNSSWVLLRQYCGSGASGTPTSTTTISSDIASSQAPPTITPMSSGSLSGDPTTTWISTIGVAGVSFTIFEPLSNYTYTLFASPQAGSSSNPQSNVINPTATCGFATPGTGTYAAKLCFVDFASFASAGGAVVGSTYNQPASGCAIVKAAIAYTPYTLSFCLRTVTTPALNTSGLAPPSGSVFSQCPFQNPPEGLLPSPIPTYFAAPTSEAFLGNNGFYTGIPGSPALYQCVEGSTSTVYVTSIQLLDSNGNAASGWHLVTGDAESTDSGELITWTADQVLTDLPNSPSSQIGNACAYGGGVYFTAPGTTVTCKADINSDKTGTVMLSAPAPTTLTVQMVGAGLEGIFIGVLLP
jgi:hypothetical protein